MTDFTTAASSPEITVVIPVYGCAVCLHELYERLCQTISPISDNFEIIFINDDSPDASWRTIKQITELDSRVIGLNLSRNFGQHNAITAGLDWATGKWIVVMDCDLQDVPEEISKLYSAAKKGHDVVFARRLNRQDSKLKCFYSKIFHKIFGYFIDQESDPAIANYCIISNTVRNSLIQMREQSRAFPVFVKWLGFDIGTVDVNHAERAKGKSSYTLKKMFKLAGDSIISQSNKPLRLSIKGGFLLSLGALIYAIYRVFMYFGFGVSVTGWTSVIVSIYFLSGVLLINMGILGLYIGKTFNETKGRPIYAVKDVIGIKNNPCGHNKS
jgi:polyisoprenyl-phosphate glycosyltransferase